MRLGQGRENAKLFIKENPDLCAEIEGEGPPRSSASAARS